MVYLEFRLVADTDKSCKTESYDGKYCYKMNFFKKYENEQQPLEIETEEKFEEDLTPLFTASMVSQTEDMIDKHTIKQENGTTRLRI